MLSSGGGSFLGNNWNFATPRLIHALHTNSPDLPNTVIRTRLFLQYMKQVKCDAAKPACAACLKSASAQGRPLDDVICDYDDQTSITRKNPRKSASASDSGEAGQNGNGNGNGRSASNSTNGKRPSVYHAKSSESLLYAILSCHILAMASIALRDMVLWVTIGLTDFCIPIHETGDYANGRQNADQNNSAMNDIPQGVMAFSGMDWVGASSLSAYPAFSNQNQGW